MAQGEQQRVRKHCSSKAVTLVILKDWLYAVKVARQITGSNGSRRMASVVAAYLASQDAGVLIEGQVAGIGMGIVKKGGEYRRSDRLLDFALCKEIENDTMR